MRKNKKMFHLSKCGSCPVAAKNNFTCTDALRIPVGGGQYDALESQKARKRETCSAAFMCVESIHS